MAMTLRKSGWAILLLFFQGTATAAEEGATVPDQSSLPTASGFDWTQIIVAPGTAGDPEYRQHFEAYRASLANHSYAEAETSAKQMVELVTGDAAADRSGRSAALHNLAVAQHVGEKYDAAILNYQTAIDIIVVDSDILSQDLVMPLRGLGAAYQQHQQPVEAFQSYDRALHVSNVNYGPHSLNQLPILNSKMQVYLDQNDPGSALDVLDRIYMLYTRKYSRDSLEFLPALYQQAEFYGKLKLYSEENRAWRHVLAIKQKHYADNDLALIEPNIRIAENYIRQLRKNDFRSVTTSSAKKHLKRALWIAENSPDGDWNARTDCLLSIADFYTLFDMRARANRYYSAAWDLLSSSEMSLVALAEHFEAPVPLARPTPDPYANFEYNRNRDQIDPDDYLDGEMTVEFTVNDRGRTRDLRIVAADPPDFSHMEKRVRNAVEEFIYRPRYVDGSAVATADQQYRVSYFYRESEYRASVKKSQKRVRPWISRKD